jgi:hypothetical protein
MQSKGARGATLEILRLGHTLAFKGTSNMAKTIDYLKLLAEQTLPHSVQPGHELETLRFLRAAGWVDAAMPRKDADPAIVNGITFAGRAVLDQVRRLGSSDGNDARV